MIRLKFHGPTGPYGMAFDPVENSTVEVTHGDVLMRWHIEVAREETVPGLTSGARALWGDEFWFEVSMKPPVQAAYYGDRVLRRVDLGE